MIKYLVLISLLLPLTCLTQLTRFSPPKDTPDTLYFPFINDVQLIVINSFDTYVKYGTWIDSAYPRGGSWFMDNPNFQRNVYLFRDKSGKIIKSFHAEKIDTNQFKATNYINTNSTSLATITHFTELHRHLLIYSENQKVGLLNLSGEIVIPTIYDDIRGFQDRQNKGDRIVLYKDNKFGFLNHQLKELFPPIYRVELDSNAIGYPEYGIIDERNIKVFKGEKCGLISPDGKVLIDFKFDDIRFIQDTMYLASVYRPKSEQTQTNLDYWNSGYQVKDAVIYNKHFKEISRFDNYQYLLYYGVNRLIVKKNDKFGVVNTFGEVIVPLAYEGLSQENAVYMVRKENKMGVLNMDGKMVLPCDFQGIQFYEKAIYVTQNGLIGVYNLQYKEVASPQFQTKHWDMGKYILTREDGTKGFVQHKQGDSYYVSPEGKRTDLK